MQIEDILTIKLLGTSWLGHAAYAANDQWLVNIR